MSATKHTPGPWRLLNIDGASSDNARGIFAGPPNRATRVATVHRREGESNADDNARLVVAAPDLYEALQYALPFIEDSLHFEEVQEEPEDLARAKRVIEQIKAALAKAEGSR